MVRVFIVKSPAFGEGQEMAQKYGKKIQNVSPPLEWEGAPDETRSFALACVDIHPVARGYVHWLIADISPRRSSLPELPEGAAGSSNPDFTEIKPYAGPFPPSGTHDYEFTLYALQTDTLGVRPGATLQEFRQAAEQNSLATATLIGKFTKIR
jgi:Raf kinase inhibitor-like YbhB/YbcL family protein